MDLSTLLMTPFLGQAAWLWLTFLALVIALLAFDLGVLHRTQREIPVTESLMLSGGYEARADLFDYLERFHNPRMRRRVARRDREFQALIKPSVETG